MAIRVLVLSGGGGRGAFHAGVYQYLCEAQKSGVDSDHEGVWSPDIIVGTSIGAVNGAAITQGVSASRLAEFWKGAREHHIQGLPPGMKPFTRWIANRLYKQALGVKLPSVKGDAFTTQWTEQGWEPLPFLPRWLADRLVGRWSNLLDTQPLRHSLMSRLDLNPEAIANSPKTLLINATDVQTGKQTVFSNRPIYDRKEMSQPRKDVKVGIDLNRIIASCSIPMVYPWTVDTDEEGMHYYWDGAVVANTPLSPALDAAANEPIETPMEAVVVLMTPWSETGLATQKLPMPRNFLEAATVALDWFLLASFRETLKLTRTFNKLAAMEREHADPQAHKYRDVNVVVVAPEAFMPITRILDYDVYSETLIQQGYEAAKQAFTQSFPA